MDGSASPADRQYFKEKTGVRTIGGEKTGAKEIDEDYPVREKIVLHDSFDATVDDVMKKLRTESEPLLIPLELPNDAMQQDELLRYLSAMGHTQLSLDLVGAEYHSPVPDYYPPILDFSKIPTDITQQEKILDQLRTSGHTRLAGILKGTDVEYTLVDDTHINLERNGNVIATLETKDGACSLTLKEIKLGDTRDVDYLPNLSEITTDTEQQKKLISHLKAMGYTEMSREIDGADYRLAGDTRMEILKGRAVIATIELAGDAYLFRAQAQDLKTVYLDEGKKRDEILKKEFPFKIDERIDVTKDGFLKVREESTPSCQINKDGSCHDYGTGEHYSDIVSLLYDGYHAFDSLPGTMEWVCSELGIDIEVYYG